MIKTAIIATALALMLAGAPMAFAQTDAGGRGASGQGAVGISPGPTIPIPTPRIYTGAGLGIPNAGHRSGGINPESDNTRLPRTVTRPEPPKRTISCKTRNGRCVTDRP
jgi:hypothetical protein